MTTEYYCVHDSIRIRYYKYDVENQGMQLFNEKYMDWRYCSRCIRYSVLRTANKVSEKEIRKYIVEQELSR